MTNNTSIIPARLPLASMIASVHQDNPILQTAVRSHCARTIFPTTLSVAEAEQAALYPGYYLRAADSNNYWIGSDQKEALANLDRACDLLLKPSFGYEYDIEYSFGHVIGGGSPWSNMSALDAFV